MKLLFRQRFFSWFDSYDIYDENGETVYTVRGELAWGHLFKIYDRSGAHAGTVQEHVFRFLPEFSLYTGEEFVGKLTKEFTFFKPRFSLDCNGWDVTGDWLEWDYNVSDGSRIVMHAGKEIWNWTDTYTIDIDREEDALLCLMIVLAIDAAKCSQEG